MDSWLLQVQQAVIPEGIDPMLGWLVALIFSTLTSAIAVMWRQSVVESKRKDELIDRLLAQIGRAAEATDRTLSLVERRGPEKGQP